MLKEDEPSEASRDARRARVLVVGESLVDEVHTGPDASVRRDHVGGSPLNVAVGLSRLGVETVFVSQVGDDERGHRIRDHLADAGVTLVAAGPRASRTSVATATVADDGRATYDFDVVWQVTDLPDPQGFDAVHVGSLGAAVEPGARAVRDLAARARAHGLAVSFDPNVRLRLEPDAQVWRHAFESVLPHVTLLKMSDEDAEVLRPGDSVDSVVAALAGAGRLAAVTCGSEGSFAAVPGATTHVGPSTVRVADTIGAGDSYMAALLAWAARREWPEPHSMGVAALRDAVAFAARAAAITCSRPGADPPWASELPLTHEGTTCHG